MPYSTGHNLRIGVAVWLRQRRSIALLVGLLAAFDAYAGSHVFYDVRGNTFAKNTSVNNPCTTNSAPYDGASGLRFTGNVYDDGTALPTC